MNRLSSILLWSVISAAFIGPGTVTTAASAGAAHGLELIWVLVVSTIACIVLQINVTQITIRSEKNLGELLRERFSNHRFIPLTLGIGILFGCAAYQAGNLLGATLGLNLILDMEQRWVLVAIVVLASALLWFGSMKVVVSFLGSIVALMGVVFVFIVLSMDFNFFNVVKSSVNPTFPFNSEILVMGLIGTTIVPYNLFLGSGLSKGKNLRTSRFGLIVAISIGGLISIFIMLSGTMVFAPFEFEKLASALSDKFGSWANYMLAIGLFSAGFTSAMTAPLAAVLTIKSVFPNHRRLKDRNSAGYRSVWIIVMICGLLFGFMDIKPIPAIIFAQAVNGILLPFVAVFILILTTSALMGSRSLSTILNVCLLAIVVYLILAMGAFNLLKLIISPNLKLLFGSLIIALAPIVIAFIISMQRQKGKG